MLETVHFQGKKIFRRLRPLSVLCVLSLAFMYSCNSNEHIPDVSNIKVTLKTQNLERDLHQLDTNRLGEGLQHLYQKYPDFLNFYLDTLMGFKINGNYADTNPAVEKGLRVFLTNKDYRGLFDTVEKHFPDTKGIEKDLANGFQFMKYYYPDYKVPNIIYLVSGLNNWGAFTFGDGTIGIGLDMFLGGGYPYYRSVGVPDYMNNHLCPPYIPVAVFSTIYQGMRPFDPDNKTLLDMMVQRGKQQYFVKMMLPHTDDTTRFGYTAKQLAWCRKSEAEIYNFFIRGNLFYDKDGQKVYRYVFDGPNSAGMPAESPGNIGSWLGLQIVTAYMNEHKEVTLQQLIAQHIDAQKFLEESKYRPK